MAELLDSHDALLLRFATNANLGLLFAVLALTAFDFNCYLNA